MFQICPSHLCTGCAACSNICPNECIRMLPDNDGFLRPIINIEECIYCDRCINVCPIVNMPNPNKAIHNVYACWNNIPSVRFHSSSGGAFSALAQQILIKGGVVFGAAYDQYMNVMHIPVSDLSKLPILRGSKYVQSNIGNSYLQIQNFLRDYKKVLFSGTPCQVAALYSYLGHKPENLFTCDLICKGVPSPELFFRYIQHLEEAFNEKITRINFRDKRYGWNNPCTV